MSSTSEDSSEPIQPVKGRRSSILTRKSIAPTATQETALLSYITELEQENEEWINLTKQRYRDGKTAEAALAQVTEAPPILTLEDVKMDLREEDLKFTAQQPDYRNLSSAITTCIETVGMFKMYTEEFNSMIQVNHLLAKSHMDAVARNVCLFNEKSALWKPIVCLDR